MLREGYIEAKYSNDEELAPLRPMDLTALHHYWFGATDKGMQGGGLSARLWESLFDQLTANNDGSSTNRLETSVVIIAIQQVVLR
jgi:hypothetical protein